MAEKHYLPVAESPELHSDWASLVERAVDDVSRILRSEAQMFQTSIASALERQISKSVTLLAVLSLMICGGLCILSAAILLLHQWLPLWQAFGCVGLASLIAGIIVSVAMRPGAEAKP